MGILINILAKIISSLLTLFILFINFDIVNHMWKWGFDKSDLFILIPLILLLVFFIYFTYKIFTKKDFINELFHNPLFHKMKQLLLTLTNTKLKKVILHLIVVSILMSLVSLAIEGALHNLKAIAIFYARVVVALYLASALFFSIFIFFHSFINIKNVYTKIVASVNLVLGVACACFAFFGLFMITWGVILSLLIIYGSAFLWYITPKTKIISNMRRILVNFALLFPLASFLYYIMMGHNGIKYLNASNLGFELLIPWWIWLILIGAMIAIPILNKFFSPKRTSDRSYEIRY